MPSGRELAQRQAYDMEVSRTGRIGNTLRQQFVGGISNFNPQQAYEARLRAAQQQFQHRFGEGLQQLRGQQVGMGRLNTGFATGDEDRLFRQLGQDYAQTASSAAQNLNSQRLQQLNMIGNYGQQASNSALEARAGEYQTLRHQRLQDQASRRSGISGLIQGGLGAVGTILGGPIGGAIASRWSR